MLSSRHTDVDETDGESDSSSESGESEDPGDAWTATEDEEGWLVGQNQPDFSRGAGGTGAGAGAGSSGGGGGIGAMGLSSGRPQAAEVGVLGAIGGWCSAMLYGRTSAQRRATRRQLRWAKGVGLKAARPLLRFVKWLRVVRTVFVSWLQLLIASAWFIFFCDREVMRVFKCNTVHVTKFLHWFTCVCMCVCVCVCSCARVLDVFLSVRCKATWTGSWGSYWARSSSS